MPSARLLALVLAALLSGCSSLGYYSQAVGGHVEVMLAARPIAELVEDAATDPALRKTLEEVRRIRDFASHELGLPDNDSYRTYADLQRPFVTWNVFAAPEFSLQAENWCMLVVGCVSYRGFYRRQDAESLASEMREQGFDTYVGGIPAYSTLGYFSDPLLNTFMKSGNVEIARHIFHELAHQVVFVEGDTVFNESFATAVEDEGLRRWLAHKANPGALRAIGEQRRRKAAFVEFVKGYRSKLQEVYASNLPDDAKRRTKAAIMADMKLAYLNQQAAQGNPPVYQQWLERDLNNAKLVTLSLYTQLLPAFEALLEEEGRDLARFFRRVAALGQLSLAERKAALNQLQAARTPVAGLASYRLE